MILVTGASGFVGKNLVKELLKRNKKVRCFVRRTSNIVPLKGAEIFYGDMTDKYSLMKATKGVASVVHLAAVGFGNYKFNYKIHVEGAKNLIEACKENKIKRVIVVSTLATVAEKKSDYGVTKAMADDLFLKSGLDVTILKPDFIYGADSKDFLNLVNAVKKRKIMPVVGHGNYKQRPIYIDDVVAAIISSLKKKSAIGKTFIVASKEEITSNSMIDSIMKKEGIKKIKIYLPVWLASIIVYMMRAQNPKRTRSITLGISQDRLIDINPLINELKIKPMSFEEGLEKALKNLIKVD